MKKETKDIFMYALAGLTAIITLILIIVVFFREVPDKNKDIAFMMLGQFMGIDVMVYSYFFGSSKSSADQHEATNRAAEVLAQNSSSKTIEKTEIKTN